MDSRFSDVSRKILRLSHDIAAELGYNYVGTEHIVAGILRDATTEASAVMEQGGVDYDSVIAKITEYNAPSGKVNPNQALPITPRTRAILEISFNEAKKEGSLLIEPEHIFSAILREGQSVAAKILRDLGFDFSKSSEAVSGLGDSHSANATSHKGASKNLEKFATDLTRLAEEGKFDPIIGRDKEIERVVQILSRRTKTTPVL